MVDVIALDLEEARARLAAAAIPVGAVHETRPPRPVELAGALRVIRVRQRAGAAELVVTRERYAPRVHD